MGWSVSVDGSAPLPALGPNSSDNDILQLALAFTAGPYQSEEFPNMYRNMQQEVLRQRELLIRQRDNPELFANSALADDAPDSPIQTHAAAPVEPNASSQNASQASNEASSLVQTDCIPVLGPFSSDEDMFRITRSKLTFPVTHEEYWVAYRSVREEQERMQQQVANSAVSTASTSALSHAIAPGATDSPEKPAAPVEPHAASVEPEAAAPVEPASPKQFLVQPEPYKQLEEYAALCARMNTAVEEVELHKYHITVEPQTSADHPNQTNCLLCKRRVLPLPGFGILESRCRCKALCHDKCANVCIAASQAHPDTNIFSKCQRCLTPMKLDRARAPSSRILASLGGHYVQCTLCDNLNEPGSRTLKAGDLAAHRKSHGCLQTLSENSGRKVRM